MIEQVLFACVGIRPAAENDLLMDFLSGQIALQVSFLVLLTPVWTFRFRFCLIYTPRMCNVYHYETANSLICTDLLWDVT